MAWLISPKERFDAGVRRGGLIAQDMVAIPISAEHRMVVVASPQCLQEQDFPTTPAQLLTLPCINLQVTHSWPEFCRGRF